MQLGEILGPCMGCGKLVGLLYSTPFALLCQDCYSQYKSESKQIVIQPIPSSSTTSPAPPQPSSTLQPPNIRRGDRGRRVFGLFFSKNRDWVERIITRLRSYKPPPLSSEYHPTGFIIDVRRKREGEYVVVVSTQMRGKKVDEKLRDFLKRVTDAEPVVVYTLSEEVRNMQVVGTVRVGYMTMDDF